MGKHDHPWSDMFFDEFEELDLLGRMHRRIPRRSEHRGDISPHATDNPNVRLHRAHYSDERYMKHDQTTFGRQTEGIVYEYTDRLWQWDYAKAKASSEVANESDCECGSASWWEVWLSHFYDGDKITVEHVMAGVNKSSLDDYEILGFRREKA